MKDCKWNPPTAGTKGIHLDEHGRIVERAGLAEIPDNTRMLKLVTEDGDRRARRRAERQVQSWIADGSYAKLLAGEIDPPTGWVLHTHRPDDMRYAYDQGTGRYELEYNFTKRLGFVLDGSGNDRRPLITAAINSLVAQGRIPSDELSETVYTNFTTRNYDAALALTGSPTTAVELLIRHGSFALGLDAADPRLGTKLNLLRAAPSSLENPAWASLVSPKKLLEHAAVSSMDPARFAETITRAENIARSAGISPDSFSDPYAFGELATRPDGPLGDDSFALTYLSVLSDPAEQRALAIVLAAVNRFDRSPAGLAQDVSDLPEGVNSLDSLVRFTAGHLRAGHIHGDTTTATDLLLECIAGKTPPPATSVSTTKLWRNGPLGTISTRDALNAISQVHELDHESHRGDGTGPAGVDVKASHEAGHAVSQQSLTSLASAVLAKSAGGSWDTVLVDSNSREEIVVAAALAAQRTALARPHRQSDSDYGGREDMAPPARSVDPEFERLLVEEDILANISRLDTKLSFRELARRTADEAIAHTSSYETLALALLSDASTARTTPAQLEKAVQHLSGFIMNGSLGSDARDAGLTATVLAVLADECEAVATGGVPTPGGADFTGLADPHQAQRLYQQARAAVGDLVGTAVEVCPPSVDLVTKFSHYPTEVQAHITKLHGRNPTISTHSGSVTLALSPDQNTTAVASRVTSLLAEHDPDGYVKGLYRVKLRDNEVLVEVFPLFPTPSVDAYNYEKIQTQTMSARAALVSEFVRDNEAALNKVVAARGRDAEMRGRGVDPEFSRLLEEEGR